MTPAAPSCAGSLPITLPSSRQDVPAQPSRRDAWQFDAVPAATWRRAWFSLVDGERPGEAWRMRPASTPALRRPPRSEAAPIRSAGVDEPEPQADPLAERIEFGTAPRLDVHTEAGGLPTPAGPPAAADRRPTIPLVIAPRRVDRVLGEVAGEEAVRSRSGRPVAPVARVSNARQGTHSRWSRATLLMVLVIVLCLLAPIPLHRADRDTANTPHGREDKHP